MKIGPFASRDMEEVEKILKTKAVEYRVIVDKESLRDQEARFGQKAFTITPSFNPEFIYVELNKKDFFRLGRALEKFGIVEPSTGEELFGVKASEVKMRATVRKDPPWLTILKIAVCALLLYLFARYEMSHPWHRFFGSG